MLYRQRWGALIVRALVTAQGASADPPPPPVLQCSMEPFDGPRDVKNDPVTFENVAGYPLDLYYWNGTCEEKVSWGKAEGMQPFTRMEFESTHGHTFRARGAQSKRMLMQYTLSDLVIRPCDNTEQRAVHPSPSPGAISLERAALNLASSKERLRAMLEAELSRAKARLDSARFSTNASIYSALPDGRISLFDSAQPAASRVAGEGFSSY